MMKMNFFKKLTQRIWFGKKEVQRLEMILQRGGPQSLADYLFLFPGACPKCGYRQVITYEETEYLQHKHGMAMMTSETGRACTRCDHRWDIARQERFATGKEEMEEDWYQSDKTPLRITSPYLSQKQSDVIPEFPFG